MMTRILSAILAALVACQAPEALALDVNGQLKRAQLEKLAADPTGTEARVYYNTADDAIKFYDGASWLSVADSSSAVVNPMDSAGDMMVGGVAGAVSKLDSGTIGQRLRSAGAASPTWGWSSIKSVATGDYTANNYTVSDTDGYDGFYCATSTTNRTLTIAVGANNIGRRITVVKTDSGSGKVTLTRQGSDNFGLGTATTVDLLSQGDRITIEGDTGRWRVIEFTRKPITARYHLTAATGNLAIANNTRETVDFNVSDYDSHSSVTTGTSWVFTAKRAMTVAVKANLRAATTASWDAGENLRIEVRKGTTVMATFALVTQPTAVGATQTYYVAGSTDLSLASGDTVDVQVTQNTGGSLNLSSGDDDCTISVAEIPDLTL